MKILITGASGYVGAKIYADLKNKFDITGTYKSNKLFEKLQPLDITNKTDVLKLVQKIKPQIIIHVAANPNPRWCENNPEEAIKINQTSTKYLVDAANNINAKIIYISSYAAINHKSLYATTKLNSETFVKNTAAGFNILRLAHVVGHSPNTKNDRQYNRFLKNLLNKVPAIYDDSWKFQPTYLHHVSEIIMKLIELNISNEILPVAVPELTTRFNLAKDILSPFGIDVKSENKNDQTPIFF